MVVAVHVKEGDRIGVGHPLGLLEAMKMEIGFAAPVGGIVTEVRVRKGQQVAAGDVILVIDPAHDDGAVVNEAPRTTLPTERDSLAVLFTVGPHDTLGEPDLSAADQAPPEVRRAARKAVDDEVRRALLGFDVFAPRIEKLNTLLEAPLPEGLSEEFRLELAEVRHQLRVFADIEHLFTRTQRATEYGELNASNHARLYQYVRRIRAEGAGISEDFLKLVRNALAHYGVDSLSYTSDLERAVLRMFASQLTPEPRHRLVMGVIHRIGALVKSGVELSSDMELRDALNRIAGMRGLISNALADAAVEASYSMFERPRVARVVERTTARVESWLKASETELTPPPEEVLADIALAPTVHFARVLGWLREGDVRRRSIALGAVIRRQYAPDRPIRHASERVGGTLADRLTFDRDREVIGALAEPSSLEAVVESLLHASAATKMHAVEIVVPLEDFDEREVCFKRVRDLVGKKLLPARLTLSLWRKNSTQM
jgi:hypothetical protein